MAVRYFSFLLVTAAVSLTAVGADPTVTAQAVFDDLFGEAYTTAERSVTKDDDVAVAKQLLDATTTVAENTPLVILLADKARTLAMNTPDGYPLAVRSLNILLKKAPAKKDQWLTALLEVHEKRLLTAPRDRKQAIAAEHADAAFQAVDALIAADRIPEAQRLLNRARMNDLRSGRHHADLFAERIRGMADLLRLDREVTLMKQRLERDPADTATAEKLARTYLTEFDSPQKAAPFAGQTANTDLIAAVALAMKDPDSLTPPDLFRLGEFYESLAANMTDSPRKAPICNRAYNYLDAFLKQSDQATGVEALKAKVLRDRVATELTRLANAGLMGDTVSLVGWVDVLQEFDPKSHAIRGKWVRDRNGITSGGEPGYCAMLPVRISGAYELLVTMEREKARGFSGITFPIGDHSASLMVAGATCGIDKIGEKRFYESSTRTALGAGFDRTRFRVHLLVTPAGKNVTIEVRINGRRVLKHTGPIDTIRAHPSYAMPTPGTPGMVISKITTTYTEFKVRQAKGKPELTRTNARKKKSR